MIQGSILYLVLLGWTWGEPTNLDFIDLIMWTVHCLGGKWSLGSEKSAKQE